MQRTHKYTWEKRQIDIPDAHSRDYNKKTSCQLERAPEFWCLGTRTLVPSQFFWCFLGCFSHLCWQCSDKTRKCQEYINILGKKDKLTFLTPILEIKTKKLLLNLKGHQSSGAWAPELWCPKILLVVLCTHIRWQSSSYFLVHINITKTTTTIQHL